MSKPASTPMLDVRADDPVELKVSKLQDFLGNHYFARR